jgi:alpha-beta hydrolase superfamily lysophospholipase
MNYVEYFLAAGWNVLLFDFAGCGVSGGDTISLGYRESADLALMVAEARRRGNRRVVLWGRSMGASTSKLLLI